MTNATRANSRAKLVALGLLLFAVVTLVVLEIACQIYARAAIFPKWDAVMADSRHFYTRSENPELAYELRPGAVVERDTESLRVNSHGIRDDTDSLYPDQWRVAVLGDSVVFGFSQPPSGTISGRLQAELDPTGRRIKVLNFGVPGLNVREIDAYLRQQDAVYDVDEVIYLYNPNDLSRRESIYEGADNGLYRMYVRPGLMLPWFIRKAVYRWNKQGKVSVNWYEWFFEGNEQFGYDHMQAMADFARQTDCRFSVVLLPSAIAYTDQGYALEPLHAKLRTFFESAGIPYRDPTSRFASDPYRYYDETDHFHYEGNVVIARAMAELVQGPPPR